MKKKIPMREKRWKCRHTTKSMDGFCEMRMLDHDGHGFINVCTIDDKPCKIRRVK